MQQGGGIGSHIGQNMLNGFFSVILMIGATIIGMMMRSPFPMQRRMGQIFRAGVTFPHPLTSQCKGLEEDEEQQDSGAKPTKHDLYSSSQKVEWSAVYGDSTPSVAHSEGHCQASWICGGSCPP